MGSKVGWVNGLLASTLTQVIWGFFHTLIQGGQNLDVH